MNYKLDLILLEKLSTKFEIGIYTKGVNLVEYLWQIPTLLSTLIFARSAVAKDNMAFSHKLMQLLRISTLLMFLASVFLYIIAPFIIVFLFGDEYYNSINVLRIAVPGIVMMTCFKILNMDLAGKGKPWVALIAMTPALLINIYLNYLLVPAYGANGASIATTISYALGSVIFLFSYSKVIGISLIEMYSFKRSDFDFIYQILKLK